ncbi:hypothetical protein K461DRAFT_283507 [Myriangium duriaei CBS 260.36]|uniref:DUF3533 domain-containing protein n=1 Tax=Myriangium duriaei CBS 260.36 TaxID=1168546 RepID=A0A9P4IS57_9PEZI|nr:hypothetical protein K461DRAFT_283507 [Myriangium duriaei CBS 260.36]
MVSSKLPDTLASANRIDRQQRREAFWRGRKKHFFLVVCVLAFLLQMLFLSCMSYLYGSIYKMGSKFHNFKVLHVDYDGGVISQSLDHAYSRLEGAAFPTFVQQPKEMYPTMDHVIDAIKDSKYWAAFVVSPNASNLLAAALQGGTGDQPYNPDTALQYVWNEVKYPPFSDQVFEANFERLTAATRLAYNALNGSAALSLLNKENPASLQVLLNPIGSSGTNIMTTIQPTKLFYNTVSFVMPILQQFFFLLVLNGISNELQLYSSLPLKISGLLRIGLGITYAFLGSLGMAGYIFAFDETWNVTGHQFAQTWMVLWLLMHSHFVIIDSFTAVLPLPALPFFLLIWIILNITSSISPFEVNPGFYKWGICLPTHQAYSLLLDIWSFGKVPKLSPSLPVLFAWWIVGCISCFVTHLYRCHKAFKLDVKLKEATRELRTSMETTHTATDDDVLMEIMSQDRDAYKPSIPLLIGRILPSPTPDRIDRPSPDPYAWTRFSLRGFE